MAGDALLREVRACTVCAPHLPLGPRPILQFDPRARLLIVGQAPGRKAHERGMPFADVSGDRLRAWLGITTEQFYDARLIALLPMGFCYPGTGKGGDLPPRPECAQTWRERLLARLPAIELTLVIGQYAADWHLPDASHRKLADLVADWKRHWPRLLPMPHPSPRNQRWLRERPWFERDVLPPLRRRVQQLLSTGSAKSAGRTMPHAT
jgi:uracil-DNA glycosylase